jgi:hypothetical protein
MNPNPITGEDLDDLSDLVPVGDPEDGGIVYTPVDIRDYYNFAEFAEAYFLRTRPSRHDDEEPGSGSGPDSDPELIEKMARRYATQVLGWEARKLDWAAVPGTFPMHARHELDGTLHRLHYRPHSLTGDYELVLERYCRLHESTDFLPVNSLPELGALLAGKAPQR